MSKIYAQVVNGMVNLIGGEEVGLPFNNDIAKSIEITDTPENELPQEGWYYQDGVFGQIAPIQPPPEPTELELLQEQLLGTQDNFDIMYAQMLMLQGVTVSV